MHFTLVTAPQDSPQAHSSSHFPFQGTSDLLENVTGWALKGGAELTIPLRKEHLLGSWCPRTSFSSRKLPSGAPGAATFQPKELKTLHKAGDLIPQALVLLS